MKKILIFSTAAFLTACGTTQPVSDCSEPIYGCNNGQAQRAAPAAPAKPTSPGKPTEKPGDPSTKPEKPGKPHGDNNHGHSGPKGHGKKGGAK